MPAAAKQLEVLSEAKYRWRLKMARDDLATFIETCGRNEEGDRIELDWIHRAWIWHLQYCWSRGLHAMIQAPMESGKCGPANHKVQMADGSVATLGQLRGLVASVLAYDFDAGAYRPAWGRCFDNGQRRVWKFHLSDGRSIEVTDEHPFLTVSGWVPAKEIRQGRFVAVSGKLPSMGHRRMRPGEAALLGFLVGDGCVRGRSAGMTNGDPGVIDAAIAAAAALGFGVRRDVSGRGVSRLSFRGGVRPWIDDHGLRGSGSRDKRTPPAIFVAAPEHVAEYIAAYFACDGTVSRGTPVLYSVNRPLLEDVQSLLLRFGVRTTLRPKRGRYLGKSHLSWQLAVSRKYIEAFRVAIRIPGLKGEVLAATRPGKVGHGKGDIVPHEYRDHLVQTAYWHKTHHKLGLDSVGQEGYRHVGAARETVRRAALAEGNAHLMRVTDESIAWAEVTDVEDLGLQQTYGLEVDGLATYVSGDVIVHNSSALVAPLAAWLIGRNPNTRIKTVCNADAFAERRVAATKMMIESPQYREVFPRVHPSAKWANMEFEVRRQGAALDATMQARGVSSKGVGLRADYMIFDDVCDQLNTRDEAVRNWIKSLVRGTWLTRLAKPHGRCLWIATAWHNADATQDLMQDPRFCTLVQRVRLPLETEQYEQELFNGDVAEYLAGMLPAPGA